MQSKNWPLATLLRVLVLLAAAVTLAWTFEGLDLARVKRLFSGVPPWALLLVIAPQFLALALESRGWRSAFALLGRRVSYLSLLRVRLCTEALAQTLPVGAVFSESLKPRLLARLCGVPTSEAIAGMAARKYLLMSSQCVYVLVMGLAGFGALRCASLSVLGVAGLEYLVLGAGLALVVMAMITRSALCHGALARRLLSLLLRVPSARLRAFLSARAQRFAETDSEVSRYFDAGFVRSLVPASWFLAGWVLESVETFVIVRALGVALDFTPVAAFEVALSFVRNVAFVLPAGLGVQDLGYVAFMGAFGIADPVSTGAAFVVLKRSKELFWAAAGYWLLAWEPRRVPALRSLENPI